MNSYQLHTVADFGQVLKDLEALEARVTTQDLYLAELSIETRNQQAQLYKLRFKNHELKRKLQQALDLLDRINRSHEKSEGCHLSPYFENEVRQALVDYEENKHTRAEGGRQITRRGEALHVPT